MNTANDVFAELRAFGSDRLLEKNFADPTPAPVTPSPAFTPRVAKKKPTFMMINGEKHWLIKKVNHVYMKKTKGSKECRAVIDWEKPGPPTDEPITNIIANEELAAYFTEIYKRNSNKKIDNEMAKIMKARGLNLDKLKKCSGRKRIGKKTTLKKAIRSTRVKRGAKKMNKKGKCEEKKEKEEVEEELVEQHIDVQNDEVEVDTMDEGDNGEDAINDVEADLMDERDNEEQEVTNDAEDASIDEQNIDGVKGDTNGIICSRCLEKMEEEREEEKMEEVEDDFLPIDGSLDGDKEDSLPNALINGPNEHFVEDKTEKTAEDEIAQEAVDEESGEDADIEELMVIEPAVSSTLNPIDRATPSGSIPASNPTIKPCKTLPSSLNPIDSVKSQRRSSITDSQKRREEQAKAQKAIEQEQKEWYTNYKQFLSSPQSKFSYLCMHAIEEMRKRKDEKSEILPHLTVRDCQLLVNYSYINDVAIDMYMEMIVKESKKNDHKCHAFNHRAFLKMSSKKDIEEMRRLWTRRVNVFTLDTVIIPVHRFGSTADSKHWALIVIKPQEAAVKYYDTLGWAAGPVLKDVKAFLEDHHVHKFSSPLPSNWEFSAGETPLQSNNVDCGPLALIIAFHAYRGIEKIEFESSIETRIRICHRLMKSDLNAC